MDVEWYREHENKGWGVKVTDALAESWENTVKSINPDYQLFLKHWDREWMPPNYRGDLVFVDDSQGFSSQQAFDNEFVTYWSKYFEPNDVIFQIGYETDKSWWNDLEDPPAELGNNLALSINPNQNCGIMWVDFTLKDVLP